MASITSSTIVQRFTPPGRLEDFTPQQKDQWHEVISGMFDSTVNGYTQWPPEGPAKYHIANNAPRPQFFNPAKTDQMSDLQERVISWIGFPKKVASESPTENARWKIADQTRDVQDEYCEWSVTRDDNKKITSVTFTCEEPDYWEFLGKTSPDKVVQLYQTYISPAVTKEDLFKNGEYIPRNKWNTDTQNGAMHLVQRDNTLFAAVELAGGASMVRKKDDRILTEQQELIQCGQYGNPKRNSDPLIGAEVNALSRAGAMVSLRDPVGLYINEFIPQGWETPDRSDAKDYWKILRGAEDTPVRAIYEVPEEKGFTVGDIKIKGKSIKYGSQIADYVQIKLVGIAQNIGNTPITSFGCVVYKEVVPSTITALFSTSQPTRNAPMWRNLVQGS